MPTPRQRAREFFHAVMGRVPGPSVIKALGDEIGQAEARGRSEVLDLVARYLDSEAHDIIAEVLANSTSVSSSDGIAQPAEDVADQHGTAAPAERS